MRLFGNLALLFASHINPTESSLPYGHDSYIQFLAAAAAIPDSSPIAKAAAMDAVSYFENNLMPIQRYRALPNDPTFVMLFNGSASLDFQFVLAAALPKVVYPMPLFAAFGEPAVNAAALQFYNNTMVNFVRGVLQNARPDELAESVAQSDLTTAVFLKFAVFPLNNGLPGGVATINQMINAVFGKQYCTTQGLLDRMCPLTLKQLLLALNGAWNGLAAALLHAEFITEEC